jgi:hypothetical protein
MGEVTMPADLRMVLEELPRRNYDSGRTGVMTTRAGRAQTLSGDRLFNARVIAQAKINLNTLEGNTGESNV